MLVDRVIVISKIHFFLNIHPTLLSALRRRRPFNRLLPPFLIRCLQPRRLCNFYNQPTSATYLKTALRAANISKTTKVQLPSTKAL